MNPRDTKLTRLTDVNIHRLIRRGTTYGPPYDPNELSARYVEQYGKMAQVAPTLADAMAIANRAVTKEDLICITGSFYLVGEAKRLFQGEDALKKLDPVVPAGTM